MNRTLHRSPRSRARRLTALALAGGLVTVAACGDDDDAADTTTAVSETTEAVETTESTTTTSSTTTTTSTLPPTTPPPPPTTEAVIPRMPLTGHVLTEGMTVPDRPALVVKIDNNPRARPQSGLIEADIVFEEVVEYGTRFAAVFHSSNANPVGPIRSGRTQDVDLLSGLHQPLFAWSGGNGNVERAIADSDLIDLNMRYYGHVYRRMGRRGSPHNLYSTTDELFAQATPEHTGRPTPLFAYLKPDSMPAGGSGVRAAFNMDANSVVWEYDPSITGYLRQTDGGAHEDALTGSQISTTNVVILETPYRPSIADARSPEAITIGGGRAWVLSGGVLREGAWLRMAREDGFALFDPNGGVIELLPGRTWVELFDPVDGAPNIA